MKNMKSNKTAERENGNIRVFDFFKVGRHVAMNGRALEFGESDLDQICRNYRFQKPVPLVIGHPELDSPAFGSVEEIFHKNGSLYAVAACGRTLLSLVQSGRFKNRSAKFAKDPTLPGFSLRHIGFLGAAAPAVRGLSPLQFSSSEGESEVLCFSDNTWAGVTPSAVDFGLTIPAGYRIDPQSSFLYNLACQLRASCPALSFAEAAGIAERL